MGVFAFIHHITPATYVYFGFIKFFNTDYNEDVVSYSMKMISPMFEQIRHIHVSFLISWAYRQFCRKRRFSKQYIYNFSPIILLFILLLLCFASLFLPSIIDDSKYF